MTPAPAHTTVRRRPAACSVVNILRDIPEKQIFSDQNAFSNSSNHFLEEYSPLEHVV